MHLIGAKPCEMDQDNLAKIFLNGAGTFISRFWEKASRLSFASMLLIVGVGISIYIIKAQEAQRLEDKQAFKKELADLRNECRRENAVLNSRIDTLLQGLNDCTQARIRAESQNAVLLQLLNRKH